MPVILNCTFCNKPVKMKPFRAKTFTSCSFRCVIQNAIKKNGNHGLNWKGGRRIDSHGYVLILRKDHPNAVGHGYVCEHRLVMEKHLGRFLKREEIVHHKNGKKDDNRIENLELIPSQSEHATRHHIKGLPQFRKIPHLNDAGL